MKVWTYYYQISNKIHYEALQILVIWVLKLISFYKKNYDLQKIVYKFGSLNLLLPNLVIWVLKLISFIKNYNLQKKSSINLEV